MEHAVNERKEVITPSLKRIQRAAMRLFAEKGVSEVNVKELAEAAGVSRGTIYNNLSSPESLFEGVADQLQSEMHGRISKSFEGIEDPAQRLANGTRLFIRRAHEEPDWGRFVTRFAGSSWALRDMWIAQPGKDLVKGLELRRYQFRREQIQTVLAMISGSTQAAMMLVLEGHKTWREASSDTAELILKALGIEAAEAYAISNQELPPLPIID